MNKTASSIAKGMAAGVAVGAVTYMMTNSNRKRSKAIKKGTGKAIKAVGTIEITLQRWWDNAELIKSGQIFCPDFINISVNSNNWNER